METLAQRYIALWNETDSGCRAAELASLFTEDSIYHDPLMRGVGHQEIDGLIRAVQAQFPAFVFALSGPQETVGEHIRFSWALGPADGSPVAAGTDFARVENGRLASVVGFLDSQESA